MIKRILWLFLAGILVVGAYGDVPVVNASESGSSIPCAYLKVNSTGTERFEVSQTNSISHSIYWVPGAIPPDSYFILGYAKVSFDPAIAEVSSVTSDLFLAWIKTRGTGYVIIEFWYFFYNGSPVNDPAARAFTVTFRARNNGTTNITYDITDMYGNYRGYILSGTASNIVWVPMQIEFLQPPPPPPPEPVDTTPPTGSISIQNGTTYIATTDCILNLHSEDPESGVSVMRFSNDAINWSIWEVYGTTKEWALSPGDGVKTVYVEYKNGAGLSATFSATIILDTTPPEIIVSSPYQNYNYTIAESISISYLTFDNLSGMTSEVVTLNSAAVTNNTQKDGTELPVGENILVIRAVNAVGLTNEVIVRFNIVVTFSSLQTLIERYYAQGLITNYGIYNSLLSQLNSAENSYLRGNLKTAGNQLKAMVNHIKAQAGKHINSDTAGLLIKYIEILSSRMEFQNH